MTEVRTLASLLAELPGARLLRGERGTAIDAVEHDSRQAKPGTLFVAIPGFTVDGHQFLPQVAAAGAAAVVVQADHAESLAALPESLAVISVPQTRPALA